jgi:glyceraldehyde-3-phosphate dehydrogenase/erythrose-4-phosphate dehydrogenase
MTTKVGLMGFGRSGRNSFCILYKRNDIQSNGDGYARVVSWYDNEWGYSNRCVDVIERLGQFG